MRDLKNQNRAGGPKSGLVTLLVIAAMMLISAAGDRLEGRLLALICTAFILFGIVAAVLFAAVRLKRAGGPAAAAPRRKPRGDLPAGRSAGDDSARISARSDAERKVEGINDLYAAGIINAAERAERLAALR